MDPYVITISRKFGSLGHEIASQLGDRLRIPVYDRTYIEAENRRREASMVRDLLDSNLSDHSSKSSFRLPWKLEGKSGEEKERQSLADQAQILRDLAAQGSCIILGRGGDLIFEGARRTLHVYLFSPDPVRLQNCVRMLNTDEETARALIRREDRSREAYRRKIGGGDRDLTDGRHLLIDTSIFGADGTCDLLEGAVRGLFGSAREE